MLAGPERHPVVSDSDPEDRGGTSDTTAKKSFKALRSVLRIAASVLLIPELCGMGVISY